MLSQDDVVSLVTEAVKVALGPRGSLTPEGEQALTAWISAGALTLAEQPGTEKHHLLVEFVYRIEVAIHRFRYFGTAVSAEEIHRIRQMVCPFEPFG